MDYSKLRTLNGFWADIGVSRVQGFYLSAIGRGPETISVGSKKLVTPAAGEAWLKEMAENPIVGNIRELYLATKSARAAEPAIANA